VPVQIMPTPTPMRPRLSRSLIACAVFSFSIASFYLQTSMIMNTATPFNSADDSISHGRPERKLIHVISPYITNDTTSLFAPLSEEQYVMLVSIKNAQQEFTNNTTMTINSGFDSVLVVCAVLPDEYDTLHDILAPYCQRISTLSRHTGTEYPELLPNTKLPFLQDIVDAGTSSAERNDEDFYLMLTNADICLTTSFFTELSRDLARTKRKALSINRKVLLRSGFDVSTSLHDKQSTPHSIAIKLWQQAHDLIDKGTYTPHGGYDCFIMHSSVVRSLNFGKQFAGFPFWGTNIDFALHIMAKGYRNVKSKGTSWGTFHIGDDNSWSTSNMFHPEDDMMTEWKKFSKEDLDNLAWCPVMGYPPQDRTTLQNAINCGKWFRPASSDTGPLVPAFVNDGYDMVYLENFAKHLNFTSEGLPRVPWKRNKSNPKLRQQWIQKWGDTG
jgi:hypothetical protein